MNTKPNLNIIMLNMSSFYDWDHGIVNRNYNILNELAKHEKVEKIVGVDFLPLNLKSAIKHYFKNILWEIKTAEMVYGDLTSACYQRTDKVYAYTTIDSLFSFKTVVKELKKLIKILKLQNVVIWSFNPMFTEFIGKLNEQLFVFDTVDNWLEHPVYPKVMKKSKLKNNYNKIANKADLIFTVSNELTDFFKQFDRDKDVHWLPNAVDFDHFNNENSNKPNELDKFKNKIVGYLGTIEERFDIDLVAQIAKNNCDKEIVLCGPIWPIVRSEFETKLKLFKNVHCLGRIAYKDSPSYLNKFDVAIIPHKLNKLVHSMNPMKMYEYLACGKPVVSTNGSGVEMFKDQIYIVNSTEQFIYSINKAIATDSIEKQQNRRNAVKNQCWQTRVNSMLKLVLNKIKTAE